jgi:LEA14-like dessication related protein
MKLFFLSLLALLLCSSCLQFEELDFNGMDGIKFVKFEGKRLVLDIGVKIENPNSFAITVKPSTVDILVDDQLLGKGKLIEKVKLLKKTNSAYRFPVQIDFEDGATLKLFKYALRKTVAVRIKGKVKGSVCGISKKTMIDEVKEIDGSVFKLDKLLGK